MTAIQPAHKRILFGNAIWASAYSFLVLLIRFYEGVRLTHQTSESGPWNVGDQGKRIVVLNMSRVARDPTFQAVSTAKAAGATSPHMV